MSPSPVPDHNRALFRIGVELERQLPREIEAIPDMDVDLQLAPPDAPGTVRRPDLIVVPRDARMRVRGEGGVIRASEVLIAMEVVSPGSKRTDHDHKRGEYADAGIPHYWIVDIEPPVSLLACHLAGEFGYADGGAVTGTFTTSEPFAAEIDLDALL
jgi:Uma2 family endonuclease